jgi:hypothetical protein
VRQESGSVKTTSIEPRERPMWARGSAHLDGNGIVLRREDAEDYAFFEEDRLDKLVLDVAGLRSIGTLTDSEQLDPQPALAFVNGMVFSGTGRNNLPPANAENRYGHCTSRARN